VAADDADALYGLPLDAFIAERDALAKRLRADGRRDEADEVKALRKPSVAAWAVNQVVRSQPKPARALWKAGDALIGAQDDLLAGRADAAKLRTAVEDERAALDALLDAARGLLTGEGHDLGDTTIERVRDTLHAGAIDAEAREEVAAGRAVRERAHAGLGAFGAAPPVAPASRGGGASARRRDEAAGRETAPRAPKEEGREKPGEAEEAPAKGRAGKRAKGRAGEGAEGGAGATEGRAGGAAGGAKGRAAGGAKGRADGATGGAKAKAPTKAEIAAAEKRESAARREEERKAAAARDRERRDAARAKADAERELREARKALEKAQRAADRANDRLADAQSVADDANAALDAAQAREAAAVDELERAGKRSG